MKPPNRMVTLAAFFRRERALHRAVEMVRLVEAGDLAQSHAFRRQPLLDFRIIFNLDESSP